MHRLISQLKIKVSKSTSPTGGRFKIYSLEFDLFHYEFNYMHAYRTQWSDSWANYKTLYFSILGDQLFFQLLMITAY